jgi:hypothetical protein
VNCTRLFNNADVTTKHCSNVCGSSKALNLSLLNSVFSFVYRHIRDIFEFSVLKSLMCSEVQ